jgi:NAD(P)-dependent dehydrogenase (short-subunit alcohol dehydrogenase family)
MSSGAATSAYSSWGAYGSSKAALHSLATHIAVEEPDITTISVSPGRVDTNMQATLREYGKGVMNPTDYEGFTNAWEQGTLFKPEQPAAVISKITVSPPRHLSGKLLK